MKQIPAQPGFGYPENVVRDTPTEQKRLLQKSSALAFQTDLKQEPISTQETIDEIDNIMEMTQAMNVLGISCKCLKKLDQMKDKVTTSLN